MDIEIKKRGRGRPKNEIKKKSVEYVRDFINKNKEKINESIKCEICGGSYSYFNKSRHQKSDKHIKYVNFNNIDFPDIKDKIIYALENKLKLIQKN